MKVTNPLSRWSFGNRSVEQAAHELAGAGRPGVWWKVEHSAASGKGEVELRRAWDRVIGLPMVAAARRDSWRSFGAVVAGDRAALEREALGLWRASCDGSSLHWRVVLVEILPHHPRATLQCDPAYALDEAGESCAVWVRPRLWDSADPYPRVHVLAPRG